MSIFRPVSPNLTLCFILQDKIPIEALLILHNATVKPEKVYASLVLQLLC